MCFQEYEEAEAIGLEDALKMQVKRYMLEQWINEPFFEATLTGCMVRISIGRGSDAGYLAAEITGVEEPSWQIQASSSTFLSVSFSRVWLSCRIQWCTFKGLCHQ